MRNPIEMMVQNMLRQGGNPQTIAQNIIKNNPQFAQQLQGKNLQELAMQEMRKSGIEPRMFMDNMFGKR